GVSVETRINTATMPTTHPTIADLITGRSGKRSRVTRSDCRINSTGCGTYALAASNLGCHPGPGCEWKRREAHRPGNGSQVHEGESPRPPVRLRRSQPRTPSAHSGWCRQTRSFQVDDRAAFPILARSLRGGVSRPV